MLTIPYSGLVEAEALHFLRNSVEHLPPEMWWIPALALLALGGAAALDAITAAIPDLLILPGTLAIAALQGMLISWDYAAVHLGYGVGAALLVWALNAAWFMAFRQDALGMGDAKWTMMAVSCFGLFPVLVAWGVGACLAASWIGGRLALRRPISYVHFSPFLFAGLIAALWWVERFRP